LSPREFDDLDVADLYDLLDAFKASHPRPGPQRMSKAQRDRAIEDMIDRIEAQKRG